MPIPFRPSPRRLAFVVACALVPVVAEAQLGGLLRRAAERKAEEKASESVEDRANVALLTDPTFDATTVELTDDLLDRWLAAAEANRARRAEKQAEADAMQGRATATGDSARALENAGERSRFEGASMRYDECRSGVQEALSQAADKRQKELERRVQADPLGAMRDPVVKSYVDALQAYQAASERGDSAASRRAYAKLLELGGATDSASLDKQAVPKCGARPLAPAWIARQQRLQQRSDSLGRVAMQLRSGGTRPTAAQLGVSPAAAAMIDERIQSWLNGMRRDAPVTTRFTRAEYDRLVARRGKLRKARYG